jgi:hypothetical protein
MLAIPKSNSVTALRLKHHFTFPLPRAAWEDISTAYSSSPVGIVSCSAESCQRRLSISGAVDVLFFVPI